MDLTRREMLKTVGLAAGSLAVLGETATAQQMMPTGAASMPASPTNAQGKYALPPLPYAYNALAPHISEQTLKLHHDKHHAKYVTDLNATLEKMSAAMHSGQQGEMDHLATLVAFNGSGDLLHTLYWQNMIASGGGEPKGEIATAIDRDMGSYSAFAAAFAALAAQVRGSGWAVLAWEPVGTG